MGSIHGQGTRVPCAVRGGPKEKRVLFIGPAVGCIIVLNIYCFSLEKIILPTLLKSGYAFIESS